MASKYDNVRKAMQQAGYSFSEAYRDKAANGNVILKWMSERVGGTKEERAKEAADLTEMFAGMHAFKNGTFDYVTKVVVRNATASMVDFLGGTVQTHTWQDYDKVCVYIDTSKM